VGTRHPAHCSSLGKVILAFSEPGEIDKFLAGRTLEGFTRNTITSPALFVHQIETVRRNGYAIDDEEREEGLRCIGAPVRSNSGEVIASVSVAGPVFRITRDRIDPVARAVVLAADQISVALGYRPERVRSSV
jgi:IclR family acetate operon transcriptional repressor